ncbi:peroxisomal biogenesis factor 11 [Umbelopsis sp. PMI_123]|nr:peroxisomal biogenesis factor 11 [Umbelopsis sp. PMI_123]
MTTTTNIHTEHNLTPPLTPPLLSLKDASISNKILQPTSKPPVTILRKVLTLTDGRDKALKLIQYFIKIILHHGFIEKKRSMHASLSALASNFSTTRKIIRLGHIIEPAAELYNIAYTSPRKFPVTTKEKVDSFLRIMSLVFGIGNDLADDIYCLSKINVMPATWAKKAEPWSYRCWFTAILIDTQHMIRDIMAQQQKMKQWKIKYLHLAYPQTPSNDTYKNNDPSSIPTLKLQDQLSWIDQNDQQNLVQEWTAMQEKLFWLQVSLIKTLMDGGFCGYDLFQCQFSNGFQAWTGFISGALSAYKLWYKNST